MTTPYNSKPAYQFHSKTVKGRHPAFFDPIASTKFEIHADEKIATMGSCFAQNLSLWLKTYTTQLHVVEKDIYNSGIIFSGNYGNVYTIQQAEQILDRAFGRFTPSEEVYEKNGKYFDPLRPGTMPTGLSSKHDVLNSRIEHEKKIKLIFEESNVFVFTLGLTECWIRKSDGAVLPLAPGVVGGEYRVADYEFKNFRMNDVIESLQKFIEKLTLINPEIKILLTVSPVPLAATFENRHVSVASMASKAVLRAAASEITDNHDNVDYFPSFEIFFTPGIGQNYFDSDGRHIRPAGINHAMRLFSRHYLSKQPISEETGFGPDRLSELYRNTVCDEDKLG